MIVVDTNVIAYLYLSGEHTEEAEEALKKDPQWAAPFLWRSELRNILARYVRSRILYLSDALQMMEQAERQMNGREYAVPSAKVLELSCQSGCSAYDCEFVQLALDMDVSLVTSDKKILLSFPKTAMALGRF